MPTANTASGKLAGWRGGRFYFSALVDSEVGAGYTHVMKETISIEDFAKIEIKIGTILEAELVPETDKLIKCIVDVGEDEPRTIVSGIAQFRNHEDLVGKQLPYITNLAPRMIKGVESNGMLLAVGDENSFALLHPDVEVPPGTSGK